MNQNFHQKVASVRGGLEAFDCAGFIVYKDEDKTNIPNIASNILDSGDIENIYLKHFGHENAQAELKLHYSLFRYLIYIDIPTDCIHNNIERLEEELAAIKLDHTQDRRPMRLHAVVYVWGSCERNRKLLPVTCNEQHIQIL